MHPENKASVVPVDIAGTFQQCVLQACARAPQVCCPPSHQGDEEDTDDEDEVGHMPYFWKRLIICTSLTLVLLVIGIILQFTTTGSPNNRIPAFRWATAAAAAA
jgi:hypothetical protein